MSALPIVVLEIWPRESECRVCGKLLFGCKTGIPFYEDYPVTHGYAGEWGGFDACQECFDQYTEVQAQGEKALWAWYDKRTSVISYEI